jgi:hypothetical protein
VKKYKKYENAKDPDLASIERSIDLAIMRAELKQESKLPLARRAAIYGALAEAEPKNKDYAQKAKTLTAQVDAERRATEAAAESRRKAQEEARRVAKPERSSGSSPDNLTKMTVAFKGNYSREQIKARLERAMILYDVPITEENYSRAASALIVLRQNTEVTEMEILDSMIRSHVAGLKLSFPDAAAISATFLHVER